MMFYIISSLTGLAGLASAHMIMTTPEPYGKASLNNSPLAADGSDFPCKQRPGVYTLDGASNVFAQGSTEKLSFQGSAVHGGGSCQVSVTTDLQPTKNSVWKVIQSIEGGCPAKNQQGNLGYSADEKDPYTYDYTISKQFPIGNYTLAWTWFNKVGNREMYMNCGPLTVTGSGGDKSYLDSLPDMFVANVGNQCTTKANTDLEYPNPGEEVDKFNGATDAFATATGPGCQQSSGGSGGGSTQTTAAAPAPTSSQASQVSASASASTEGGVFVSTPGRQTQASHPATTEATPPSSTSPAESAAATPTHSAAGGSSGSSGSSGTVAAGTACSSEGEWNCIGGSSFQRCASGMWSAVQPMAAGVSCQAGQSSELVMTPAKGKRLMRRALRLGS